MPLPELLRGLLADPPPDFCFEVTEEGLAWTGARGRGFAAFEPGTLRVSPAEENILRPEALTRAIREAVGAPNGRKRRTAAVILPDFAGRTTVLDFDAFPAKAEEQETLVRFRLRKSVPFDIDSAAVSFVAQPRTGSKKTDVVASAMSLETLARYEAPFRAAGLQVGVVMPSMLAALESVPNAGCRVTVKVNGHVLCLAVTDAGALRLVRTIELTELSSDAVADHVIPTLTFLSDEWGRTPEAVYAVGLPPDLLAPEVPMQLLQSPHGAAQSSNAGLLGWMSSGGRI